MKTKKKGLQRNLGLHSAGICRIYSCWLALFHLIIQRSILDGGRYLAMGGASPYNFSTDFRTLASLYSLNDFRNVALKLVPGLLVLLRHKCICLLMTHLTTCRTYFIVYFFIHHSTLQQCIFSKMTCPSTLPFG